jgi:hypothetical protein
MSSKINIEWQKIIGEQEQWIGSCQVMLTKPSQDERLLYLVEEMCEDSGQEFKRVVFKQTIEIADLELSAA